MPHQSIRAFPLRHFVDPVCDEALAGIALVGAAVGTRIIEILNIYLIVVRAVICADVRSGDSQALAPGVVAVEGEAVREAFADRSLPRIVLAILRVIDVIPAENQIRIGADTAYAVREVWPPVQNELHSAHADVAGLEH